ncbi:MAG: hypothetical protein IKU98_03605 [Bacteroidaceae bacterium]|nr:hypothetical protein [Bacteroidaceae bacterium]
MSVKYVILSQYSMNGNSSYVKMWQKRRKIHFGTLFVVPTMLLAGGENSHAATT